MHRVLRSTHTHQRRENSSLDIYPACTNITDKVIEFAKMLYRLSLLPSKRTEKKARNRILYIGYT